ncbi:hypothetical protein FQZ97_951230 [compost metagenome]
MGVSLSWSATRAHSNDSMAPRMAMVRVGVTSRRTVSQEKSGSSKAGTPCGMPPKREPIVSTGMLRAQASSESVTSATTGAGRRDVALSALTVSIWSSWRRNCESTAHRRGQMNRPITQRAPRPKA